MMHRRRLLGIAAASLAVGIPTRLSAQAQAPLRIACTASDSYAEALYATDEGFFTRAGLTPDLQVLASGAAITAAVAAGAVDIGITNPLPLILGVEARNPVRLHLLRWADQL